MRALIAVLLMAAAAHAQVAAPRESIGDGTTRSGTRANITIGGYAEMFYQWNFNEPANGITNARGFDNRHNSFTIANAVLDVLGAIGPVNAHVALQVGHTPDTYYLDEPVSLGGPQAGSTGPSTWRFLQQANAGWKIPLGRGILVEGGIFLSPIGPEGMAIKDQWNWSRSNLFFALPFYHTGLRVTYGFTDRLAVSLHVYNGWNSVVDNNAEKSLAAQLTYTVPDRLVLNLLYFTGVERAPGAPEGRAWRHLFDAYLGLFPRRWLSILVHADGGFEPNLLGTSAWASGALYLRFQPKHWLYLSARGDFFYEKGGGTAARIFWPVDWVSSGTLTVDTRPYDNISIRAEYRHDQAASALYYQRALPLGLDGQPRANAVSQDTLTLGVVAWF